MTWKKKVREHPKDVSSRIQLAQLYEKRKLPEKVISVLIPVSDTLARKGLLILARAYNAKKDHLNEIRVLENLLVVNENDYVVQFKLGEAYVATKRREDGIARFRAAKQANPQFLPAYDSLLRELNSTDDRYEARTLLNDMIKSFGEKPNFLNNLCRLYSLDSFIEKSLEVCQKAIEKDPRFPDNHVYLGLSLKDSGNIPQAEKILFKAAQQFKTSEHAQWVAGQTAMESNKFHEAYKYFSQGVLIAPKSARVQLGLGKSALELKKQSESLKAFTAACKLDRTTNKDFRVAVGVLRKSKDLIWAQKFEEILSGCSY